MCTSEYQEVIFITGVTLANNSDKV